jgi:hypothetical protein
MPATRAAQVQRIRPRAEPLGGDGRRAAPMISCFQRAQPASHAVACVLHMPIQVNGHLRKDVGREHDSPDVLSTRSVGNADGPQPPISKLRPGKTERSGQPRPLSQSDGVKLRKQAQHHERDTDHDRSVHRVAGPEGRHTRDRGDRDEAVDPSSADRRAGAGRALGAPAMLEDADGVLRVMVWEGCPLSGMIGPRPIPSRRNPPPGFLRSLSAAWCGVMLLARRAPGSARQSTWAPIRRQGVAPKTAPERM